jgi:hypothetical protein
VISRRLLLTAVLLPIFPITACSGTGGPTAAPASAKPFDAMAALAASTGGIDAGAYSFWAEAQGGDISGTLHIPSRTADLGSDEKKGGVAVRSRALILGERRYIKLQLSGGRWDDLGSEIETLRGSTDPHAKRLVRDLLDLREFVEGKYWMPPSVVRSTTVAGADLTDPDAAGVKRLLKRVRTAEGTSLIITGTLDATGLAKDPTMIGSLAKLHPPAGNLTAVPFRATLDAKDRIATIDLTMPKNGGTWSVKVQDYDMVRAQTAPDAREIRRPSPEVLKLMAGAGVKA